MEPTPKVALVTMEGHKLLAIRDGFAIKDVIRESGGRYIASTKEWVLASENVRGIAQVAAALRSLGGDPTLLDFVVRGGVLESATSLVSEHSGEIESAFIRPSAPPLTDEPIDDITNFPLPLYPYQRVGARFARVRKGSLIADEMGLGKSRQSLAACALEERVLIISPAVVKSHWRNEAAIGLECEPVVLHGTKPQFIDPNTRVVVVNYDIFPKHAENLKAWKPTAVILDEVHMVKNPKALRTKALLNFIKVLNPKVVALSGTPMMNRPVELIPVLQLTDSFKTVGKDWMTYVKTFCNAKQTQFGWDTSGASNLDILAQRLSDTIMIRRTKNEVLTDLPPKSRRVIDLDLEASLAAYKAAEKNATEAFESRVAAIMKDKGISAAKALREATREPEGAAQITELRLQVGLAKMDASAGVVVNHLESTGRKAIVFAHHHEVRAGLRERFIEAGYRVVEIGGETSHKSRDAAIESFQNDPSVKVFLGSTAASVGITLTAASDVFIVEQQWTPATLDQMEDRAHRIGQQAEAVTAWHLVAPACAVDKHMWRTVERKRSITARALGDPNAPVAEKSSGLGVVGYVASLLALSKKKTRIVIDESELNESLDVDEASDSTDKANSFEPNPRV